MPPGAALAREGPGPARSCGEGAAPPTRTHLPAAGASDRGRAVIDVAFHHGAAHVHPHHVPRGGGAALLLLARHCPPRPGAQGARSAPGTRPPENRRGAGGRPAYERGAGGGSRHRGAARLTGGARRLQDGTQRDLRPPRPCGGDQRGAGVKAATAPSRGGRALGSGIPHTDQNHQHKPVFSLCKI